MNPQLFIITGTSAVGKTTVAKAVLKKIKKIKRSLTFTTRLPRTDEKNGRDYHFVPKAEFKRKIKRGEFLEWANNYGNLYGTNRQEIEKILNAKKNALVVTDIKGALNIKKRRPKSIVIFILPESFNQLAERFKKRHDTDKRQIARRLALARWELSKSAKCDYRVINREVKIPQTVKEIVKIIKGVKN